MASKAGKLPPTPELDKVAKHQAEINTLRRFLVEYLTCQKDIVLATWVPCSIDLHESSVEFQLCSTPYHLVPEGSRLDTLIYECLGLDEETMETERLTLLNHHRLTT